MPRNHALKRPRLGGAVYVIPNLITTGNLFWGFFAIIKALQNNFSWAGSAILLAAVFDMLDGRVARLTGGSSEFGVQYDSLCDLVSFGLAPAFVMYQFGLHDFGRIGWIIAFLFLACGALRLARFNVQSSVGRASGDFTGLPIPMAAGVIATFVALIVDLQQHAEAVDFPVVGHLVAFMLRPDFRDGFLAVAGPGLALLMVSNLAYRSHKAVHISHVKPFNLLVILVIATAFIAYQPELFGFSIFFLYALSGLFEWIIGWKKPTEEGDVFAPQGEHESIMEPDHDLERHRDFDFAPEPSAHGGDGRSALGSPFRAVEHHDSDREKS